MTSYLSNYDPSAFNAGLAWAAQRQAAREAVTRQAQEAEDRKAQIEQEGEIQKRNEAAKLALQYQHEAETTKTSDAKAWRQGQIDQANENYNAAYNQALQDKDGAANQGDWTTYIKSLNDGQQRIAGIKPDDPINSQDLMLPAAPTRVPGQAEVALAEEAVKHKNLEDQNIQSQIWYRGQRIHQAAIKQAQRNLNPATKLTPYQLSIAKAGHNALSALPVYIANTPRSQSTGLVVDDPRRVSDNRISELGGNPEVSNKAMQTFSQNVQSIMAGVSDPAVAQTWGLTPAAAQYIKDAAPHYGGLVKPSQWHQFMADQANPAIPDGKDYPTGTRQVILSAINNNPYVDPQPVETSSDGGDE